MRVVGFSQKKCPLCAQLRRSKVAPRVWFRVVDPKSLEAFLRPDFPWWVETAVCGHPVFVVNALAEEEFLAEVEGEGA